MVKFRMSTLALIASGFALSVIALGAFTRLIDAGLGCPDWPGCYGQLIVDPILIKNTQFVAYKAWAEMIHRYFAGCLGLLIVIIVSLIFIKKHLRKMSNIVFATLLILLLIYQILLGQWTVTLKLWPVIVTQHLLGGFSILAILWLIYLNNYSSAPHEKRYKPIPNQGQYEGIKLILYSLIGLSLVVLQITLGAWTSTHYASLSCPDFPFCFNDHSIVMYWREAFSFMPVPNLNYEGGILPESIRQTIHMIHRFGAFTVSIYLILFAGYALPKLKNNTSLQHLIWIVLTLLIMQLCVGMVNVMFKLPLVTAIAHNLMASVLLIAMVTLVFNLIQCQKSITP